jgi:hypothetical protein
MHANIPLRERHFNFFFAEATENSLAQLVLREILVRKALDATDQCEFSEKSPKPGIKRTNGAGSASKPGISLAARVAS